MSDLRFVAYEPCAECGGFCDDPVETNLSLRGLVEYLGGYWRCDYGWQKNECDRSRTKYPDWHRGCHWAVPAGDDR